MRQSKPGVEEHPPPPASGPWATDPPSPPATRTPPSGGVHEVCTISVFEGMRAGNPSMTARNRTA
jgi:hypothetical protein